jgi:hypothetical protein
MKTYQKAATRSRNITLRTVQPERSIQSNVQEAQVARATSPDQKCIFYYYWEMLLELIRGKEKNKRNRQKK